MADQFSDFAMSIFPLNRASIGAAALSALLILSVAGCRRPNRNSDSGAPGPTPEGAPPPIVPAVPVAEASTIPPNAILQTPSLAPAIKKAVERYFNEMGQAPYTCQDLVAKKYLSAVPLAQNGQPLDLNLFLAHHNSAK